MSHALNHLQNHHAQSDTPCVLCRETAPTAEHTIARADAYRIVWAQEANYPCWVRLIWNSHIAELSELSPAESAVVWHALMCIERGMRTVLSPDKINVASFGNRVPHVHWHIIPRWIDDAHWPEPSWGATLNPTALRYGLEKRPALALEIQRLLKQSLTQSLS